MIYNKCTRIISCGFTFAAAKLPPLYSLYWPTRNRALHKRMASHHSYLSQPRPMVGVCQFTARENKEENLQTCVDLITRAKTKGAEMVFLPEACDYIGSSREQSVSMAESLNGSLMSRYKEVAKEKDIWLSIGGFHQQISSTAKRVKNSHVIISNEGQVMTVYDKCHLFDLDLKGRLRLCESDYTQPGTEIVAPVQTPVGKLGVATCYDLRFPEMSTALTQQGAEILSYPSAFTQTTGMAHWEVLLRSRAIENQCYVVAAAQTGKHNDKRTSYGHAMIVDPWGRVVSACGEGADVCVAEINLEYLASVRRDMPLVNHRRHDLYGHIHTAAKCSVDERSVYKFGQHQIKSSVVFYRTALSFAFVNIKPVLPGHVLVSSVRGAERFQDLTPAEVADLFLAAQKVAQVVEKHYKASSATVAVQDGPDAGQTVQHVHVHILPRKKEDFEKNDDIYDKLEKHDKNLDEDIRTLRSEEDMSKEASMLRQYFS